MDCKNCHKSLNETQKYCDECGAKVIQNRLTPKVLAAQVNEQFISIDNKFFLTFIDLFKKPEQVINGYIDGTRKKYIDVLQYFAISLTLAGIQVFLMTTFFNIGAEFEAGFNQGLNSSLKNSENPIPNFDFNVFLNYQGLIYILSIPFYALGTYIVYYWFHQRVYNFTEHLVLNLYYSAQWIIVTSIISVLFLFLGIDYLVVSIILTIPYFAYLFWVLKRVFKNNIWETLARLLLIMIIIGVLILLISLLTGIIIGVILAMNK